MPMRGTVQKICEQVSARSIIVVSTELLPRLQQRTSRCSAADNPPLECIYCGARAMK